VRRLSATLRRLAVVISVLAPAQLFAAAGKAEAIVIVADSRRFSGWKAWWTNLYNENHLYFALATIIIIPTLGAMLGTVTGFLMARIGIDLKSRELAEH
jgi:hypothetical protein